MPFRFFRPWEDGGQDSLRQAPDLRIRDRILSDSPKITTPPHVHIIQPQQHGVNSQEETRSAAVLSDISGALDQKDRTNTTEREDDVNALQVEKSTEPLDIVMRQTPSSVSNEESGKTAKVHKYIREKATDISRQNYNEVLHGSSQKEWSRLTARKTFQSTKSTRPSLRNSSTLDQHERIHTGSKSFECSVCKKAFTRSSSLHQHERIHTGSKPFECLVCKKAFTRSSSLHQHERIHTGSKPFECSVCKKAFTRSSSLHQHERIHTGSKPFECLVCKKAFAQSSNLHAHTRIHTGSKPFECSVCKKAFARSSTLHQHKRIHNGSKPFRCTVCKKAFSHRSTLRKHQRLHINRALPI